MSRSPRLQQRGQEREQHYSKTIDEVVTQLADAKFFTLVGVAKGYWHVPLDEANSFLTTFGTPFGRFRFTQTFMARNVENRSPRTPRAGEVLTQSKGVNLLAWDYQRYHQHCKRV